MKIGPVSHILQCWYLERFGWGWEGPAAMSPTFLTSEPNYMQNWPQSPTPAASNKMIRLNKTSKYLAQQRTECRHRGSFPRCRSKIENNIFVNKPTFLNTKYRNILPWVTSKMVSLFVRAAYYDKRNYHNNVKKLTFWFVQTTFFG